MVVGLAVVNDALVLVVDHNLWCTQEMLSRLGNTGALITWIPIKERDRYFASNCQKSSRFEPKTFE